MSKRRALGAAAVVSLVAVVVVPLGMARDSGARALKNGPLTFIGATFPGPNSIDNTVAAIGPGGNPHILYRPKESGVLLAIAWSPHGRRLAYMLTCLNCPERVLQTIGLHIVDVGTGRDRLIRPRDDQGFDGFDLDWSRSGSRLAYVRSQPFGSIYETKTNGSGFTPVRTGTDGRDKSPSWSPAGTRIAFATLDPGCDLEVPCAAQSVSIIDADGSHRRLLAAHATAPAWSPDGKRIAVRSLECDGLRLLTPQGKDVTPARSHSGCRVIGVPGTPIWSPDGRQIAIQTPKGIYVMNADGSGIRLLTTQTGSGELGAGRPAWRPVRH